MIKVADALLRRMDVGDQGSFGVASVVGGPTVFSGELPQRDNAPRFSCIPAGTYLLLWGWSIHLRKFCYHFQNVAGRSGILLHPSNFMGDVVKGYRAQLQGCVSLGMKLGYMNKQKALLLSRPAVSSFEEFFKYKPFTMEIRNGL